jgi:hypothetical protein
MGRLEWPGRCLATSRMKSGKLIILTPGFRQVWRLRFSRLSVWVLTAASFTSLAAVAVIGYRFPPAVDEVKSEQLAAENRARFIENKSLEFQMLKLNARAAELEEMTATISTELREQLKPTAPSAPSKSATARRE